MYGGQEYKKFKLNTSTTFLTSGSWVQMAYEESKMDKNKSSSNKCMKIIQKFLYVSVLLFLCFLLAMQIANCIKTYINFPTYVETKIVPQPDAIFPAMTICPVSNGYKKEVLEVCELISQNGGTTHITVVPQISLIFYYFILYFRRTEYQVLRNTTMLENSTWHGTAMIHPWMRKPCFKMQLTGSTRSWKRSTSGSFKQMTREKQTRSSASMEHRPRLKNNVIEDSQDATHYIQMNRSEIMGFTT